MLIPAKIGGSGLVANLPESLIIKIWQNQLCHRTDLITEEGEPIRIIYPGRVNDGRGPDFLDAVILTGQKVIKGDIEVHVKSSGWRAHRHHQDPACNRIILHTVLWHDTKTEARLQSGKKVPTLTLQKYLNNPDIQMTDIAAPPSALDIPCRQASGPASTKVITEFLDSAGEARFSTKVAKFKRDLVQKEPCQALYQGIMGALGYSRNKLPFLELARRVPIHFLESLTQRNIPAEERLAQLQAQLMGTAGLLPSQRTTRHQKNIIDNDWVERLEALWNSSLHGKAMPAGSWQFFKVRPENFPVRRIAAMSYLVRHYGAKKLLEEVIGQAIASEEPRELEKILLITASGYWANHFDFGFASRLGIPTLLGSSRASEITVNVLLPFVFTWGEFTSQPELTGKAFKLYCGYPRLSVNTLEKHMSKQFRLTSDSIDSARRQPGLIHVYKKLCSQGNCHRCLLGRGEPARFDSLQAAATAGTCR